MPGISALDIALMDIKGKALGVPVYQLLGGKCRDEMRCYASQLQFGWVDKLGPYGKTEDYVSIVEYALSQGYDCVKIDFTQFDREGKRMSTTAAEGILSGPLLTWSMREWGRSVTTVDGILTLLWKNHCRTERSAAP